MILFRYGIFVMGAFGVLRLWAECFLVVVVLLLSGSVFSDCVGSLFGLLLAAVVVGLVSYFRECCGVWTRLHCCCFLVVFMFWLCIRCGRLVVSGVFVLCLGCYVVCAVVVASHAFDGGGWVVRLAPGCVCFSGHDAVGVAGCNVSTCGVMF